MIILSCKGTKKGGFFLIVKANDQPTIPYMFGQDNIKYPDYRITESISKNY